MLSVHLVCLCPATHARSRLASRMLGWHAASWCACVVRLPKSLVLFHVLCAQQMTRRGKSPAPGGGGPQTRAASRALGRQDRCAVRRGPSPGAARLRNGGGTSAGGAECSSGDGAGESASSPEESSAAGTARSRRRQRSPVREDAQAVTKFYGLINKALDLSGAYLANRGAGPTTEVESYLRCGTAHACSGRLRPLRRGLVLLRCLPPSASPPPLHGHTPLSIVAPISAPMQVIFFLRPLYTCSAKIAVSDLTLVLTVIFFFLGESPTLKCLISISVHPLRSVHMILLLTIC